MALCAPDALAHGYGDLDEIMANFGRWYYQSEFTAGGKVFDVGGTCAQAIDNYFHHHLSVDKCGPSNDRSNGNGSLMRIHPVVLYVLAHEGDLREDGWLSSARHRP